jgi:hypothetical protein
MSSERQEESKKGGRGEKHGSRESLVEVAREAGEARQRFRPIGLSLVEFALRLRFAGTKKCVQMKEFMDGKVAGRRGDEKIRCVYLGMCVWSGFG